jgi:hypothetical protein
MQPVKPLSLIIALVLSSFLATFASGQYSENERKEKPGGNNVSVKAADASETTPDAAIVDPLVRVLVSKGILNNSEARSLSGSGTPIERRERLAELLLNKGIITRGEFEALRPEAPVIAQAPQQTPVTALAPSAPGPAPAPASAPAMAATAMATPATATPATATPATATPAATQAPVIAVAAPIRVLQTDPIKRDGLIPDLKLGSGGKLKFYGFIRASIMHNTSSPMGNDFPLPGFLGDTGPDASPEFHIKARALRLGANFEWPDLSPRMALTGRVEFDFEGSFPRSNNRNIATIRSSQPSIRLAYGRIDRLLSENSSAFALFGQDWTPFGSSTLPNMLEITGLGLGYGTLYERAPQARFGVNYRVPGNQSGLSFQPEFALVMPAFGNLPRDIGDQEGFGERQGADSGRPEMQGRFVTQWQLDKARGVVPAQIIASWVWSKRKLIVPRANVPAAYLADFPQGAAQESDRWGYSLEAQLPTRAVTLLMKYYRGADLRFYFANQFFSNFTDTFGLTDTATSLSIDGSSMMTFGLLDGVPTIAPQLPVRGQGGFVNLGFPLSRIFNANPEGRNAGWTFYLHYGIDQAFARDVRRFGNRAKGDMLAGTIYYKFNNWVTFGYEQSYYRTRAANSTSAAMGGLPLFRGIPSRSTHNIRSEFATIFTF